MNNDLTIIEQTLTIPSAGETEAGSAEEQPARDSRLGVMDYRRGGRPQADRPAHFHKRESRTPLCLKKTSLPKAMYST